MVSVITMTMFLRFKDNLIFAKRILKSTRYVTAKRFHTLFKVHSSGGTGTARAVSLQKPYAFYNINGGEGVERILEIDGLKRSQRCGHIFVTHNSWKNIASIHNVITKTSKRFDGNGGTNYLILHGPPVMENMFRDDKQRRKGLFPVFENIKADYRHLDYGFYEDRGFFIDYVPLVSNKELAVAYIFKPKYEEIPKKQLNTAKLLHHKITSSEHIRKLMKGESVTQADGTVVHPDDVRGKQHCTKPIIFLECPDTSFIPSLLDAEKIKKYRYLDDNQPSEENAAVMVVHLTPEHILNDETYQNFIYSFGSGTRHLILNESTPSNNLAGITDYQAILNAVNGDIFPQLGWQRKHELETVKVTLQLYIIRGGILQLKGKKNWHSVKGVKQPMFRLQNNNAASAKDFCKTKDWWFDPDLDIRHIFQTNNVIKAVPDLEIMFHAHPVEENSNEEDKVDIASLIRKRKRLSMLQPTLASVQEKAEELNRTLEGPKYPEVVFLGTSSQAGVRLRNVSGHLLHIDEETVILLDCGEDTIGQIYKFYGDETPKLLAKIKGIFISHLHSDHFAGLFSVVEARNQINSKLPPVYIVGPYWLNHWFWYYESAVGTWLKNYKFTPFDTYVHNTYVQTFDLPGYKDMIQYLRVKSFQPVKVSHTRYSRALVIEDKKGKKVVYSGDTLPDADLVRAGKNCDLLIHEATFANCHLADSKNKKHSTIGQAVEVGTMMNAKFTILTHFSKKYRFPLYESDLLSEKFGIGFDFLKVNVTNAKLLGLYNEFWKLLHKDDLNMDYSKFGKRDGLHANKHFENAQGDYKKNPIRDRDHHQIKNTTYMGS